jgi:hypothetical protein
MTVNGIVAEIASTAVVGKSAGTAMIATHGMMTTGEHEIETETDIERENESAVEIVLIIKTVTVNAIASVPHTIKAGAVKETTIVQVIEIEMTVIDTEATTDAHAGSVVQ